MRKIPSLPSLLYIASKVKKKGDCYRWSGDSDDPSLGLILPDRKLTGRSCGNSWCLNPDHAVRASKEVKTSSRPLGRPKRPLEEVLASAVQGYPDPKACWFISQYLVSYNGGACNLRDLIWIHVTGVPCPPRARYLLSCGTPKCRNPRHAKPGQPGIDYGSLAKEHEAEATKRIHKRKF